MASKGQMTGMLGVYLTAAELVKRGFIVSPTSRSALGADLLITDQQCKKARSVQVKTNSSMQKWWHMSSSARELISATHKYVFVSVPKNPKRPPQFYVVPSRVVARSILKSRTRGDVYDIRKTRTHGTGGPFDHEEKYKDKWKKAFGDPLGAVPAKTS